MEAAADKDIGRPIIGHTIVSYTPGGIRVSGVQYAREKDKMFGANEDLVRTLNKERIHAAGCRGEQREFCRLEYTAGIRHG